MLFVSQLAGAYALALMSHPVAAEAAEPAFSGEMPAVWAGHQVTLGTRKVPIKGLIRTRMDSFVLARLERNGSLLELKQSACDVRFSGVAGVDVSMDGTALPQTLTVFATAEGSDELAGRSVVAWSSDDIDDDGNPGITIHVDAPICSGDLYVANHSRTTLTATLTPSRLEGDADIRVKQQILGAKGACLSAVAKNTDEKQFGPFAYVPVSADATCESLLAAGWPVSAN